MTTTTDCTWLRSHLSHSMIMFTPTILNRSRPIQMASSKLNRRQLKINLRRILKKSIMTKDYNQVSFSSKSSLTDTTNMCQALVLRTLKSLRDSLILIILKIQIMSSIKVLNNSLSTSSLSWSRSMITRQRTSQRRNTIVTLMMKINQRIPTLIWTINA